VHEATAQLPAAHPATPLLTEHIRPQPPQCEPEVFRFVSHPLVGSMSQLPKPAVHAPNVQEPIAHEAAAEAKLQRRPHTPQLEDDVCRSASQPLDVIPSQSPRPVMHIDVPHVPMLHEAVDPIGAAHAFPQRPQWFGFTVVIVSQPLLGFASQSPVPAGQPEIPHTPIVHDAVAPIAGHALPHIPQWVTELLSSVSQPLAAIPSQSPKPVSQLATAHIPIAHEAVAWGSMHRLPQRPQLFMSVARRTHSPMQDIVPAGQLLRHIPSEQKSPIVHALPQRPQLDAESDVSTQRSPQSVSPPAQGRHSSTPAWHRSPV
jgi:hypothetical protein